MEKTDQQKKAVIISAEGDSKATELIANSFHTAGDGLIGLRKLEATVDIVYRVSGQADGAIPANPGRPALPAPPWAMWTTTLRILSIA